MSLLPVGRVRHDDAILLNSLPAVDVQPWIDAANRQRRTLEPNMYGAPTLGEVFKMHNVERSANRRSKRLDCNENAPAEFAEASC